MVMTKDRTWLGQSGAMRFQDSIDVAAPADEVFATYADLDHWPDWTAGVTKVEVPAVVQELRRYSHRNLTNCWAPTPERVAERPGLSLGSRDESRDLRQSDGP